MSAFDMTDEELDALAEITEEDIEEAAAFWEAHAPEELAGLLDAEPDEDEEARE
jgi:hypothetical protein